MTRRSEPIISVVVPTFNRSAHLATCLGSLTTQSLPRDSFEAIVIDDGSRDDTAAVARGFADRLTLRYQRIRHVGAGASRNLGLFLSTAPLVHFMDDDDTADPRMLEAHVGRHLEFSSDRVAVLGHTEWSSDLCVSALMEFVTGEGGQLFSYGSIWPGDELDFRYFWTGRISVKKSFLASSGLFDASNPTVGLDDIEAGYRLWKRGLSVWYEPRSRQYMNRALDFDAFRRRCHDQGIGQRRLIERHGADPAVRAYCFASHGAPSSGGQLDPDCYARIRRLEAHAQTGTLSAELRSELHALYGRAFFSATVAGYAGLPLQRYGLPARPGLPVRAR